jgi:hypothetical protein
MKTILVANLKGGCGKTITAITLATALAQKGYKVALADADGQKSALQWLKQRPEQAAKIQSLDWRHEKSIGDAPKNLDYLVIDAPGPPSAPPPPRQPAASRARSITTHSHADAYIHHPPGLPRRHPITQSLPLSLSLSLSPITTPLAFHHLDRTPRRFHFPRQAPPHHQPLFQPSYPAQVPRHPSAFTPPPTQPNSVLRPDPRLQEYI